MRSLQNGILTGKFAYPSDYPALAKDLTSKLLKPNPVDRIAIADIMKHPWFIQNQIVFDITQNKIADSIATSKPQEKDDKRPVQNNQQSSAQSIQNSSPRNHLVIIEKKPVVYEMEGKKLDESEIVNEMPTISDTEAS